MVTRTLEHLERLVGFASLTDQPNGEIVDYIAATLSAAGARVHRIWTEGGEKSGLLAALGPDGPGGIMLSGHVDVVPVEGQAWSGDPFRLRREGTRALGRGTADMKGFLACALAAAERAGRLAQPLKLAFSWDEEIGCKGIPVMLDRLDQTVGTPALCVVGEPTRMQIATGHKGKRAYRALCRGEPGHSAEAPRFTNALHLAADLIAALRDQQAWLEENGGRDVGYATPFSTVHAGLMHGGTALNIVPEQAEILFEIRHLPGDDPGTILARLRQRAARIGAVEISQTGGYPGLETARDGPGVQLVRGLLPQARLTKVSFGTEAGHFAQTGVETVVCGPGDMAQGHTPDEFIELGQLEACDRFLDRILAHLAAG